MMRTRHGRACSGHPRLGRPEKTWMRGSSPIGANLRSSLPGLTRQSIDLRKNFLAKKMDARVKPAHDELAKQLKLAPMGSRSYAGVAGEVVPVRFQTTISRIGE